MSRNVQRNGNSISLRQQSENWFQLLRDDICSAFEQIEEQLAIGTKHGNQPAGKFQRKIWERDTDTVDEHGGGGIMSIMHGRVFEKVGVNISTVHGTFSNEFREKIPGAAKDGKFWASGISLVAHMHSPLVPAVHMNTRHIITTEKSWFGGGADMTPTFPNAQDTQNFHAAFKHACDIYDETYYPRFKQWCDEYFYLPHRKESRGVGGIFYDNLNTDDPEQDFYFTKDVGKAFLDIYPKIVKRHMDKEWTENEREELLKKRGRYVEFNLLYDRGTSFGLKTGGNTEAILMSLPPEVKWP